MLDRLKRLLSWLCCLFVPATKPPMTTSKSSQPHYDALPWIVPPCRSCPVPAPRNGKTGVAAIKRAARKRRNRQRSRR